MLVDAADRAAFRIGEGLPPAIRPLLTSLGLQTRIEAQAHRPALANRSAWGSAQISETDFIMHPFGHGWHLDRRAFEQTLVDAAGEAGAVVMRGTVRRVEAGMGTWCATVTGTAVEAKLSAEVVVDCSGRRALFARRQGARRRRRDRLVALAALLASEIPDADATTLVEAVGDGWWHTAQLPGAQRIAIYFTDSDLLGGRSERTADAFRARLAQTLHVGSLCAERGYRLVSLPWIAAADTARLDHVYGDGWIAAGDAAASFDPVSSQGIMSAIQSGQDAARAILCGSFDEYADQVDARFRRYAARCASVYAQERRWVHAPFWSRRQRVNE